MRQLITEEDFQRHRASGRGYIYNDFSRAGASGVSYNVLHLASCRTLLRANTNVDKYFAADAPKPSPGSTPSVPRTGSAARHVRPSRVCPPGPHC